MHAGDELDRLADAHPARQDGDVGDEADIVHQRVALGARVASEDVELAFERDQPEDRLQRGGLAGAVGADEADDAAGVDLEGGAVQRQLVLVGLAQAAGADDRGAVVLEGRALVVPVGEGVHWAPPRDLISSSVDRPRRWMRSSTSGHSSRRNRSRSLASSFLRCFFGDVHPQSSAFFNKRLVGEFLVGPGDGDRIELVFGCNLANGGQCIAGLQDAVEHHCDDALLELAIDGSAVAPGDRCHGSAPVAAQALREREVRQRQQGAGMTQVAALAGAVADQFDRPPRRPTHRRPGTAADPVRPWHGSAAATGLPANSRTVKTVAVADRAMQGVVELAFHGRGPALGNWCCMQL